MTVEHLERLYNVYAVAAAELFIRCAANNGIHMYRIYRANIRMLIHNASDGAEHMMHRLAEILAAVRCYEN